MWECESIYNYLAERGKAERRDRTAAGQTGSSQCASEPLTAHITDKQSELQLQLLDWEWGRPGDLSSLSMAEEEGGAEDTSFLRTVSIQYSRCYLTLLHPAWYHAELGHSFAGVDKFYSLTLLSPHH